MMRSEKEHNPKAIQLIAWPHITNSLGTWPHFSNNGAIIFFYFFDPLGRLLTNLDLLPTTKIGLATTLSTIVIEKSFQTTNLLLKSTYMYMMLIRTALGSVSGIP